MVAKITLSSSIKRTLCYNEQKLIAGRAACIYAHHFLKEAEQLDFYEKLGRFQALISLNKRTRMNTLHLSLNFGVKEKISRETLVEIASAYMERIGFGRQPYLVYEHLDAAHTHIHILSTNIQKDGKRISLNPPELRQSRATCKGLEKEYNLQRAGKQKWVASEEPGPVHVQKLVYGKSSTMQGITRVLDAVLTRYKYGSLDELNAILKLYNVSADRGREEGIIFQKRGLLYRVLDEQGKRIGVPIKASAFYNKPTLGYLEKKFRENEILKQAFKKNVKTAIDWVLVRPPKDLQAFKQALEGEKISLVVRQNEVGDVCELTYIDHNSKCAFTGSDIGITYGAKGILEKCGMIHSLPEGPKAGLKHVHAPPPEVPGQLSPSQHPDTARIIKDMIKPSKGIHYRPHAGEKGQRRGKKRNL